MWLNRNVVIINVTLQFLDIYKCYVYNQKKKKKVYSFIEV